MREVSDVFAFVTGRGGYNRKHHDNIYRCWRSVAMLNQYGKTKL